MMLKARRQWTIGDLFFGTLVLFAAMTAVASCVFVLGKALSYPNAVYVFMAGWMSWAILRTFLDEEPEHKGVFVGVTLVLLGMATASAWLAQVLVGYAGG